MTFSSNVIFEEFVLRCGMYSNMDWTLDEQLTHVRPYINKGRHEIRLLCLNASEMAMEINVAEIGLSPLLSRKILAFHFGNCN